MPKASPQSRAGLDSTSATVVDPNVTVMVVEDDVSVLAVLTRALMARGYTVLPAVSAELALRIVENWTGNLALLVADILLPGMRGTELADRMRALQPGLGVLFISGYGRAALPPQHAHDAFLDKPFRTSELVDIVDRLLNRRQAQAAL